MKQHLIDMYINDISKNFAAELWDLSSVYECKDSVQNKNNDTIKINTISEFANRLDSVQKGNDVIIVTNILNLNLKIIYDLIKKRAIPIVCINKESFNLWLFERGAIRYISHYRFKAALQALAIFFPITRMIIHKKQVGRYKYDYLLAPKNYFPAQCDKFIKIHHIKYDETMASQSYQRVIPYNYILFIDSGPSSHPAFVNKYNSLDHQEYIKKMNAFFDIVEKNTGSRIVVSLHPKSNYKETDFNGRDMIVGKTADLIHFCEYAIGHYSTSFVNVVLEKKPLQVVYYNEMFKSSFRGSAVMGLEFAKLCDASICNMEKTKIPVIGYKEKKYETFLENHVLNLDAIEHTNADQICQALHQIVLATYSKGVL